MCTIKEVDEFENKINRDVIFEDIANGVKFICKVRCQNMCEIFPINLDELGFTDYTRNLGSEKLVELIKNKKLKVNIKFSFN